MDNRILIGKIVGRFWEEVLGEQHGSIIDLHGSTADVVEKATEKLLETFGERAAQDTTNCSHLALDVPSNAIVRTIATGKDASALYGDGLFSEQWADDKSLTITLPVSLDNKPFMANSIGDPSIFIEGIDYDTIDERTIRFYGDLATANFSKHLEVYKQELVSMYRMVFPFSGKGRGGYTSRYGFYSVPQEVRSAVFDLIIEEGSISRLLNAIQRAMGIVSPRVFDKEDSDGSYTEVLRFWNDGGSSYGWTSGGELISVPLVLSPSFTHGSTISPSDPITTLVQAEDKISDTDIIGYWFKPEGSEGLVVLNTEESMGAVADSVGGDPNYTPVFNLQIRGCTVDKNSFYTGLLLGLDGIGKAPGDIFDSEGRPIEQLYDRLGRKQPPAISLINAAARKVGGAGGLLQACMDNIPTGSGLIIDASIQEADIMGLSIGETIVPLQVYILTEEQTISNLTETVVQGAIIQ